MFVQDVIHMCVHLSGCLLYHIAVKRLLFLQFARLLYYVLYYLLLFHCLWGVLIQNRCHRYFLGYLHYSLVIGHCVEKSQWGIVPGQGVCWVFGTWRRYWWYCRVYFLYIFSGILIYLVGLRLWHSRCFYPSVLCSLSERVVFCHCDQETNIISWSGISYSISSVLPQIQWSTTILFI